MTWFRRILIAGLLPLTTLMAASAQSGAPDKDQVARAQSILDETGISAGLVVNIGCGSGELVAALGARPNLLIQGLGTDVEQVRRARERLKKTSDYGRISIERLRGKRLPYADGIVNLVIEEQEGLVPDSEIQRVLCPGGVRLRLSGSSRRKETREWPQAIDDWTHFLHGPDNNAVAHDTIVDVPRRLRWLGGPKYARAHEQAASMGACVTTKGRIFYIVDEAPRADIRFDADWHLVARDAFNGVVLWKRPVASWVDQFRRFRSGPSETAFRLAATGDRVYVTLGIDAPVSVLDAVTGELIRRVADTENARQIISLDSQLIVLVDTQPQNTAEIDSKIRRGLQAPGGVRRIVLADARTGKTVWQRETTDWIHPTMAAEAGRLVYQTNEAVKCIDLDGGKPLWQTDMKMQLAGHELGWESPTLVVHDNLVLSADFKTILAVSMSDGQERWRDRSQPGYNSPPDVFVVDQLAWVRGKTMIGHDLETGEVRRQLPLTSGYMHHRCYRNKATDRFFLLGNQGVQFVGLEDEDISLNHWIRGTCQYGILPANGLLYVTPDSCACNMKSKLSGFWALAPNSKDVVARTLSDDDRLERGPAFGSPQTRNLDDDGAWPVYRHDAERSGVSHAAMPGRLTTAWKTAFGGRLSGITGADGKIFVASIDQHTIHALDARSGRQLWEFTAGGRIDTPPTLFRGYALFGSADGYAYAIRQSDGALIWKFLAAPDDQRTFVNGQLESVWPVHGSLIVHKGRLLVPAGRSSYLDGGIRVYQLDPVTGRQVAETTIYSPDPQTGKQPKPIETKDVQGALSDILLVDGEDVYMRHVQLDFETGNETKTGVHLFSPLGLLDDSWWHRGYWVFSNQFVAHWSGWWKAGNVVPSGRILSCDESSIYGYGRDKYSSGNTGQWRGGERYRLFACNRPRDEQIPDLSQTRSAAKRRGSGGKKKAGAKKPGPLPSAATDRWAVDVPMHVRAMVVAGGQVVIAGPPAVEAVQGEGDERLILSDPQASLSAWHGKQGGLLWTVTASDGQPIRKLKIPAPPVFDGLAAANGRLYASLTDGQVVCFAGDTVSPLK